MGTSYSDALKLDALQLEGLTYHRYMPTQHGSNDTQNLRIEKPKSLAYGK